MEGKKEAIMDILMIAPQPFLEPRGTPISVYQRLKALSSLGYQVDLLTYPVGEDVAIPGVTIHRPRPVPFVGHVRPGPSWAKAFLDVLILLKAIGMLARRRYDVIHTHEEAAFMALFLSALFRTPYLYDMHSRLPRQLENFGFGNVWPVTKLFELLERWTLSTCAATITVDPDLEAYVRTINPLATACTIENLPLQLTVPAPAESRWRQLRETLSVNGHMTVLYTGNFERYQGLDLLIESMAIVREQCPEALLMVAGGTPAQIDEYQRTLKHRNLEDSIWFLGTVPPADIPAYLQIAEILVSPRVDGTAIPLKIYSYMQSGTPTIATDVPAHNRVLDEETALLVEPTVTSLAEGVVRLIRNPELRHRLGLQAHKQASEQHDLATYAAKLHQVYQALQPTAPAEHQVGQPAER